MTFQNTRLIKSFCLPSPFYKIDYYVLKPAQKFNLKTFEFNAEEVATMEDMLVNLHLGEASALSIYRQAEEEYEFLERRKTPAPGGGSHRWKELADGLKDCHAVLCTSVGPKPTRVLQESGIRVVMMEGLIEEGLEAVYTGREVRAPLRQEHRCGVGASCAGDGRPPGTSRRNQRSRSAAS